MTRRSDEQRALEEAREARQDQVNIDGKEYWWLPEGQESWGTGSNFAGQTFQGRPYSDYVMQKDGNSYVELSALQDAGRLNPRDFMTDFGPLIPILIMSAGMAYGLSPAIAGAEAASIASQAGIATAAGGGAAELASLAGLEGFGGVGSMAGATEAASVLGAGAGAGGTFTQSLAPGPFGSAIDPMITSMGTMPTSLPAIEGISQAGATSALGGAAPGISTFGPAAMTLDQAGNIVNAGMNLGNSALPLEAGLGSAVTSSGIPNMPGTPGSTPMPNPGPPQPGSPTPELGQGDIWKRLQDAIKAGTSIMEFFQNANNAKELQAALQSASQQADPFADQRGFYKDQLRQSYSDPNFFANSPVFAGMRDLAVNDASRVAAGRGYNNSSNLLHDIADRVQKQGMNYATQFQGQTGQFAGAGVNPSYSANIAAQAAQQGMQANQQTQGSIGNVLQQVPNLINSVKGLVSPP